MAVFLLEYFLYRLDPAVNSKNKKVNVSEVLSRGIFHLPQVYWDFRVGYISL
jgi:hypothetical protein